MIKIADFLLNDLVAGKGKLKISMVDKSKFFHSVGCEQGLHRIRHFLGQSG